MAITKIHSIKSTLNKAIAYICDAQKTDGKLFISTNYCAADTAYIEFEMTRRLGYNQCENLAHHLIQAFSPGEVTPEMAHEIGKKLADEMLNGKYEYVLTTHIDKGHVHNHIIFNAVNYETFKTYETEKNRKKNGYWRIRSISDKLCEEYGLSTIKNAEKGKGISHYEWQNNKQGLSWKTKLRNAIDGTIKSSKNYDDFILKMQSKEYEIKHGKHISFKAKGQERFTRSKTLGWYYEESQIIERIRRSNKGLSTLKKNPLIKNDRIGRIVNLGDNAPKGLERWALIHNMQEVSKALNVLAESGLSSFEELDDKMMKAHEKFLEKSNKIKSAEKRINTLSQRIKNLKIYRKYKPIAEKYEKAVFKDKYFRENEFELIQFELALNSLKNSEKGTKLPSIKSLEDERAALYEHKKNLYENYKTLKQDIVKFETVRKNIESYLSHDKEKQKGANLT